MQDGSVAVSHNFAASWPLMEKVLGPYVEKCFELLLKKTVYIMSSFTRFINIGKLLYNC